MKSEIRCYILVSDEKTWNTALEKNIFGFSERSKGLWNTSNKGDYLAFYVTRPIKKIIGFGIITEKFIDDKLVFPDEKIFKRALWNRRIHFKTLHVSDDWSNGLSVPSEIILNVGRKVISRPTFVNFLKSGDSKWNTNLFKDYLII